jgi:hypothetical protein
MTFGPQYRDYSIDKRVPVTHASAQDLFAAFNVSGVRCGTLGRVITLNEVMSSWLNFKSWMAPITHHYYEGI